jgi:Prokaryotic Cytochrome C oxidase subunit IV
VLLTMCTWWLGSEHDIAGLGQKLSVTTILVLTFAKVYVVGNAFMELREAARWLVLTFTIWCIALCAVLTGMYLTM